LKAEAMAFAAIILQNLLKNTHG
jgi:hypothetical protein